MHDCEKGARRRAVGWLKLMAGFCGIAFVMFVAAPWLEQRVEPLAELGRFIDRSGIETNMIWYSEIEVSAEAELGARSAVRFAFLDE